MRVKLAAMLACGVLIAVEARAELVFEKKAIETRMSAYDAECVARFIFRNNGDRKVRITGMQAGCSCTTPEVKRSIYAPGESGEIVVKFEAGPRHGVQRQGVIVKTDDPDQPQVVLFLTAVIPKVITLSGPLLLWKEGEPLDAKVLTVVTPAEVRVREIRARTGSNRLRAVVEPAGDSKFDVKVTPSPYARNVSEALQIEAVLEGGQIKRSGLYVRVR